MADIVAIISLRVRRPGGRRLAIPPGRLPGSGPCGQADDRPGPKENAGDRSVARCREARLPGGRHACSVVRLSRATTGAPGSSWYSHPAAVATSCQVRVTGPETAIVTVSPAPAEHCARR